MHGSPSTRRTHRRRRRARRAVSVTRRVRHRMRKSTRAGIFSASELRKSESRDPNPAEKRVRHPRRSAHPHAPLGFDPMSMSMSTAALAKPIVRPSRAGRRAPARRVGACVRARASSGPQWSTDKTLYGEEKMDLKEGERLQCVRTPTYISVFASNAVVRASRYATVPPLPSPRTLAVALIRVGGSRSGRRRNRPLARAGRRWLVFRPSASSMNSRASRRLAGASVPHRLPRLRAQYPATMIAPCFARD